MSRVLKFRAWDKKKNRWAREWDRDLEDQEYQVYEEEYSEDSYWLDGDVASDLDLVNGRLSLDRYIWEQYTEGTDKNGKDIYEGDIVEWVDGLGEKHIFEIMWNECRASFQMVEIGQEYPYILQGLSDKMKPYCEVIGNIHENGDLLK